VPAQASGDGRARAAIEAVTPSVDGGRFAVKRIVGDVLVVEADAFVDGHDVVLVRVEHVAPGAPRPTLIPMEALGNDRWRAEVPLEVIGRHTFCIVAWADRFATWQRDMVKRLDAGQDVRQELVVGADLVAAAAARATGDERRHLEAHAKQLRDPGALDTASHVAVGDELAAAMDAAADRGHETRSGPYPVVVDPPHARFSTWYELFPRSTSDDPGRHGTLKDVVKRLPYVAGMGFDVLYLPPIHPIGRTHRKGANNVTTPLPDDPGVPWAIGGDDGGHTAVHPELGSLDDVTALATACAKRGIRLALDIAFQASPDHPYARDHPDWFRRLPDGSIRFAENPPKKYEDIYPFDFESEAWPELWTELLGVIRHWIDHGVRVFRVDNPHTKPFPFWDWLIGEVKRTDPDILFLSEAFTRPKVRYRLAKAGFTWGYTYFTWRTTKRELTDYFLELTRPPVSDIFRPNVWPNTPDILHEYLQHGGRPAFAVRVLLAATLAASYGIYGPAYELSINVPREPGSEEYLDSEKYQVRRWDLKDRTSLAPFITRLNDIRREHPALQANDGLDFHAIDDDELLAYSKRTSDGSDLIVTVVNLDPRMARRGTLELPLDRFGIPPDASYEVEDLLDGATYLWHGRRNWIELDPAVRPGHVFAIRRLRRETEFETHQ
jgi:starch synthase (maltosyl-transferring)